MADRTRFEFYCSMHGARFKVERVPYKTAEAVRSLARALHDGDDCRTEMTSIEQEPNRD